MLVAAKALAVFNAVRRVMGAFAVVMVVSLSLSFSGNRLLVDAARRPLQLRHCW